MAEFLISLTRGFGGKLLILLVIDTAIATMRGLWAKGGMAAAVGFFVVQIPYSLIIAAIWNGVDRKRNPR